MYVRLEEWSAAAGSFDCSISHGYDMHMGKLVCNLILEWLSGGQLSCYIAYGMLTFLPGISRSSAAPRQVASQVGLEYHPAFEWGNILSSGITSWSKVYNQIRIIPPTLTERHGFSPRLYYRCGITRQRLCLCHRVSLSRAHRGCCRTASLQTLAIFRSLQYYASPDVIRLERSS